MSLGHRIYEWFRNYPDNHGVRRIGQEHREAEEQGVVKKDDGWSGELVGHGGLVPHSNPIIIFDEAPLVKAMSAEEGPKFSENEFVEVNSKVYGRWVGRVESRQRVGSHWRYTIVSDGLLIFFQPQGQPRELHRRHQLVPEDILKRRTSFAAPSGSAEAAAAAFTGLPRDVWLGVDHGRGHGGLWGFSSPPTSSLEELKEWAQERGKEWTSPAAQVQYMMERFGRTGGMMILPVAEDQTEGQDQSPKDQLEPLHREFLLTIDYLLNRDPEFAEKMRDDLLGLWHEDKVAAGLTAPQALGMTEDEYSAWVEKKGE